MDTIGRITMKVTEFKVGDRVVMYGYHCTIIGLPGKYPTYPHDYELRLPDKMWYGIYSPDQFRKLTPLEELL